MGDLRKTPLGKLLLLQALIGGGSPAVERIALGNPLTFGTDLAKPLVSLEIPFTPIQEGSGDPSPQNIRSIIPWNGLTVFGGGKNLFDKEEALLDKYISGVGTIVDSPYGQAVTGWIPVKEGEKIIANSGLNGNYISAFYSEKNLQSFIDRKDGSQFPFTVPSGANYIRLTFIKNDIDNYQVEVGQTATAYEPYHPITETDISFPSPVYGGTLDVVSGVLTVEWALFNLGNFTWNKGTSSGYTFFWCSISDMKKNDTELFCDRYLVSANNNSDLTVYKYTYNNSARLRIRDDSKADLTKEEFAVAMQGTYVATTLETPQEITLTPAQITALIGNNTIWSDADGIMTAVYLVSSKYAEEHPVGGLGSGFGSGLLGSGTEDNPEDPADDPIDDPEEEIPDNTEEWSEPDD